MTLFPHLDLVHGDLHWRCSDCHRSRLARANSMPLLSTESLGNRKRHGDDSREELLYNYLFVLTV